MVECHPIPDPTNTHPIESTAIPPTKTSYDSLQRSKLNGFPKISLLERHVFDKPSTSLRHVHGYLQKIIVICTVSL